MADFLKPSLPVLLVVLLTGLAWRAWLSSEMKAPPVWRKSLFWVALFVASANIALASGLWFYFWANPFSGIELIRLALFLGFPLSSAALILLMIGRGRGWLLAALSSAITLGGWIIAYFVSSR
jgi:hypothetical protein